MSYVPKWRRYLRVWRTDFEGLEVALPRTPISQHYFTDDLKDALDTGVSMWREARKANTPASLMGESDMVQQSFHFGADE